MSYLLGFDPGGAQGFGCALYDVNASNVAGRTVSSVDEAMSWAESACRAIEPRAAGIDTLLFWQSTKSGWRGADQWLRGRYPACASSVVSSNGLYGSMSVQGALLAMRLRERWPEIQLTETHPKVLWHAVELGAYPRGLGDDKAIGRWARHAQVSFVDVHDEHQLDAAISAWAAGMGFDGVWTRDLTQIKAKEQIRDNISLVDGVRYFWP